MKFYDICIFVYVIGGKCVVGFPELICIPETTCTKDSDCTRIANQHSSSFGACVIKGEFPSECKGHNCFWASDCSLKIGNLFVRI